ncbi:MAG: aminotransferase class I/II-fold pyridoxal phosphate-dependent enzyme [bacterium]
MSPVLSEHFKTREPSAIRVAGLRFAERKDGAEAVNVAIGNVSLPMHPAMIERMGRLRGAESPFKHGVVAYTSTAGTDECQRAFLRAIESSGCSVEGLRCQITNGGSEAMEIVLPGMLGPAGTAVRPLLLIDPSYTNYKGFADRLGRATVSITRTLGDDGRWALPDLAEIDRVMAKEKPGAVVIIPYDNPTGQFYSHEALVALARLCVKHDLWILSDEAYRELFYAEGRASSIWRIGEDEVPGIRGRRVSIESTSKVWNACGLRVGAIVTDDAEFHRRSLAEHTSSLCASAIGQWIFGAIANESLDDLRAWYRRQREYYRAMLASFTQRTEELLPGAIVSRPDAALYSVVDLRNVVGPDFDALEFVLHCATTGRVDRGGKSWTLLTAPMGGFYDLPKGRPNPGRTQMRIAYVEPPDRMALVPDLLAALLEQYVRAGAPAR